MRWRWCWPKWPGSLLPGSELRALMEETRPLRAQLQAVDTRLEAFQGRVEDLITRLDIESAGGGKDVDG